ncbi:murein biosynthesis integral membrane protein MurJ [Halodesulfovibrio marinisediminis]|uniref:Probable lipid II flippase MurJ n=1 Tax=Halodesulfovibrio marinisediminis DSM 17456 TaxID=1121457 RepID=A0A1N6J5Q3_9BACT|nr:murein biosynthesis integral membrane protein MurJ [Halodesulfovibrio marinisediminis]SIO39499.1 putative peptidoglycan lipid II flippase [Halodesulfovibrio marinisediminis DSM 17456]
MESQSNSWMNVSLSAAVVSAGSFISRIVGLLRDVLIASLLGAGPIADALIVAFRIPNLFRKLFAEGSLSSAVTATVTRVREAEGEARAASLVRTCFLWTVGIFSLLLVLAEYGSKTLARVLAPGLSMSSAVFAHADALLQMSLPYFVCIGLVALLSGVLHSRKQFNAPALAPLVLNCTLVLGAGIAWLCSLPVAETLCISLVLGGVFQVLLQLMSLRDGSLWWGDWKLHDHHAVALGKNVVPTVLSGAVFQLSVVLVTMLASFQPKGTIAKLYFADRLVQFPLGLIGVAIGVAVLPALSSLAVSNDKQKYGEVLSSAVQFTLFLSLPAAVGLYVLAYPVFQLFFERGAFSALDAAMASSMLQAFTLGLPAFSMTRPLLSGYYARQNSRIPLLAGGCNLVIAVFLGALFMQFWGGAGLAFAVSCGGWVNCILLYILLRKEGLLAQLSKWNLVYVLMSLGVGFICWRMLPFGIAGLLSIPVLALGYIIFLYIGRSPDARLLFLMVLKKGRNVSN